MKAKMNPDGPCLKTRTITCYVCGSRREVLDGTSLRTIRKNAGLGLRELARRLNLTASYLCDIELNRRGVTERIEDIYQKLI